MTPDEYCQQKAAASGSSFYYAVRFLPPERRCAITALYAFCREVDDVVDECSEISLARGKLAWWREEVANLLAGQPRHPVSHALAPAVARHGVTGEQLGEIIHGVELDLTRKRHADFASLERYCYYVAGVVGMLAAGILGYRDPRTLEYARTLGTALQLTNIIRDVGEDARKDRIYLPQDEMQRFGVSTPDLLERRMTEQFGRLMAFQAARARRYYRNALELLPPADRRAQRPGLAMAAIYRTLLDEIERDGFRVLSERTSLTPLRKFWLAWKTWALQGA
jgi:phytoene synthase